MGWLTTVFSYVPDSAVVSFLVVAFLASQFYVPLPPWRKPEPQPRSPKPDPKRES